jgi:threonine aldolase
VALAQRLATLPGVAVDPGAVRTNIVLCDVSGVGAADVADALLVRGISCSTTSPRGLRFVVHGQIGDREVERLAASMAEALGAS